MTTATASKSIVPAGAPRGQMSGKAQERMAGFLFILPSLLIVIVFVIIPIIFAFFISFTNWNGLTAASDASNVGLTNYSTLLTGLGGQTIQKEFFQALRNTTWYALFVVPTQTILALVLAVIVNQNFLKGRGFFRTAFYFPSITASVVVGIIFLFLFSKGGIINNLIGQVASASGGSYDPIVWLENSCGLFRSILGQCRAATALPDWVRTTEFLGSKLYQWFEGPSIALLSIMSIAIWTTSGTMMLIFLAALQEIPSPLYEAAAVDGATRRQQFFKITVPMLRPTTFFVITIGLIGSFQVFDQIYVISAGEPAGTTLTIAYVAYRNAFKDSQAGLGTATAFVLFIIIALFTLVQRRITGTAVQD